MHESTLLGNTDEHNFTWWYISRPMVDSIRRHPHTHSFPYPCPQPEIWSPFLEAQAQNAGFSIATLNAVDVFSSFRSRPYLKSKFHVAISHFKHFDICPVFWIQYDSHPELWGRRNISQSRWCHDCSIKKWYRSARRDIERTAWLAGSMYIPSYNAFAEMQQRYGSRPFWPHSCRHFPLRCTLSTERAGQNFIWGINCEDSCKRSRDGTNIAGDGTGTAARPWGCRAGEGFLTHAHLTIVIPYDFIGVWTPLNRVATQMQYVHSPSTNQHERADFMRTLTIPRPLWKLGFNAQCVLSKLHAYCIFRKNSPRAIDVSILSMT